MNNVIYGIFEGEYSNWKCLGYFENEEDAYRYCAETKKEYYNPYVLEINRITCAFKDKPIFYKYECYFTPKGKINWMHLVGASFEKQPPFFTHRAIGTNGRFMISKIDKELAEKTAYDLFAKWKSGVRLK